MHGLRRHCLIWLTLIFIGLVADGWGVALSEQAMTQLRESGQLDAYLARLRRMRADGIDQPRGKLFNHTLSAGAAAVDTQYILVLLVEFADKPYTAGYAAATPPQFDSILFSDGYYNPTGSMKEYYIENSYGRYVIEGDVYGWYSVPYNHDWFTNGIMTARDLVDITVFEANLDVDFSKYDNNNDGYVDGVVVIHSGTGAEESGIATEIHSHMAYTNNPDMYDGVQVSAYTIQPEESAVNGSISAIGVFCHEWGHILGLPDLYDTDYNAENEGVGHWSLMGSGNYCGSSRLPAHLDAWSKIGLEWVTPIHLATNTAGVAFPAVEFNPVVYRLRKEGTMGAEYFLVENRQKKGFDAALDGSGLLIYHVDDQMFTNADDWHPIVFVEQADGKFDLQYGHNRGDRGDPWPYYSSNYFYDKSVPDSRYYADVSSQVAVMNISPSDSIMTADLEVAFTRPWLEMSMVSFRDNAYGNGNARIDPGERIQVFMSIYNDWAAAQNAEVTMTADDPQLNISIGTVSYGTIGTRRTVAGPIPFEFEVPHTYSSRIDSFYFSVSANDGAFQTSFGTEIDVGPAQILIVDDDNNDPANLESRLVDPLYQDRKPTTIWNKTYAGSPDGADLARYSVVLWMTGDYRDTLLRPQDISALKAYLSDGGYLLLTGQGLASQLAQRDPDFLNNYLKADYVDNTYGFIPLLNPTSGPVSGPLRWIIIQQAGQTIYNHIIPVNGGLAEWEFGSVPGEYAGVSYGGSYKSVFCAFGLDAIRNTDTARFEPSWVVVRQIMEFFGDLPTAVGDQSGMAVNLPEHFKLEQNFPNPFNPFTTIVYTITGSGIRVDRTCLDIFNILGQHVIRLVDREEVPGPYQVTWDGRDGRGRPVSSGVYFYRISRGGQSETRQMILLK